MNRTDQFDGLLQPVEINRLRLKNRLVMGPMAATEPQLSGAPSPQTVAFFERRARGGIGMIIVGGTICSARGNAEAPLLSMLTAYRSSRS